jgi:hypothetical protein
MSAHSNPRQICITDSAFLNSYPMMKDGTNHRCTRKPNCEPVWFRNKSAVGNARELRGQINAQIKTVDRDSCKAGLQQLYGWRLFTGHQFALTAAVDVELKILDESQGRFSCLAPVVLPAKHEAAPISPYLTRYQLARQPVMPLRVNNHFSVASAQLPQMAQTMRHSPFIHQAARASSSHQAATPSNIAIRQATAYEQTQVRQRSTNLAGRAPYAFRIRSQDPARLSSSNTVNAGHMTTRAEQQAAQHEATSRSPSSSRWSSPASSRRSGNSASSSASSHTEISSEIDENDQFQLHFNTLQLENRRLIDELEESRAELEELIGEVKKLKAEKRSLQKQVLSRESFDDIQ